ncbi:MAG: hypothetical protein WC683_03325 [bacterium]
MKIHLALGLIVIVCIALSAGCDIAHEKTVYVIVCDRTSSRPVKVRLLMEGPEKHEYKIYPVGQVVTKKIDSIGSITYQNCSIYDADNWTCLEKDQIISAGMADGTYSPLYRKLSENLFETRIHWLRYWILKARSLINKDAIISSCEYERQVLDLMGP